MDAAFGFVRPLELRRRREGRVQGDPFPSLVLGNVMCDIPFKSVRSAPRSGEPEPCHFGNERGIVPTVTVARLCPMKDHSHGNRCQNLPRPTAGMQREQGSALDHPPPPPTRSSAVGRHSRCLFGSSGVSSVNRGRPPASLLRLRCHAHTRLRMKRNVEGCRVTGQSATVATALVWPRPGP